MPLVPFRSVLIGLCAIVLLSSRALSIQQSSAPQETPPAEQTHKPEQTEPPAQAQSPSPEQTQPSSEPSGAQSEPPASAAPSTSTPPAAPEQPKVEAQNPSSTKAHKVQHSRRKASPKPPKPAAQPPGASNDGRVVVRNGGARDSSTQLTPGMTQEQQQHSRENTAQLLATTDSNLKTIAGRQLTDSQKSMLGQIHTYLRQSKAAADAGDLSRAHTLAYKAHLLSDELARK